ncbi:hypothetical protein H0H81_001296 [Sphagnurus paluster]|uniref:Uncharacterized protein n=1 Tax=Sphagnurus paluster TaxID=117069 RepID=A0A9P7FTR4_9AGAR|nr:hypothetical protein H0H81_001296 [Sphagnurus paluster]
MSAAAIDPISTTPTPPPSMLLLFLSRFLEWLHVQPQQHLSWSNASSPRSSAEEFVLPLSASAQKTSFGDEVHREPPRAHSWRGFLAVSRFRVFNIVIDADNTRL